MIKTLTNNTLKEVKELYKKNKNLFNKNDSYYSDAHVTIGSASDSVTITGGTSGSAICIPIEGYKTYTFSTSGMTSTLKRFAITSDLATAAEIKALAGTVNSFPNTFTAPSNAKYLYVQVAGEDKTALQNNSMLEEGSVATSYVPYGVDYIGEIYQKNPKYIVPDEYTQVEYIENTTIGGYFDTGIIPITEKTAVEIRGFINNSASAFGGSISLSDSYRFNLNYQSGYPLQFRYGNTKTDINGIGNKFINTVATIKCGNGEIYVDNVLKQTVTTPAFTYAHNSLKIWSVTNGGSQLATGRIYFVNVYNDETLQFNGVPCKRNTDNKIGIYDLVSKSFKECLGTNTFTTGPEIPKLLHIFSAGYDTTISGTTSLTLQDARAKSISWKIDGNSEQGPTLPTPTTPLDIYGCGNSILPNEYKKLEYIQSTGTQYIDTGNICNTLTDEILCEYQYNSADVNRWVFGAFRDTETQSNLKVIGLARSNSEPNTTRIFYNNVYNDVNVQYVDFNKHTIRFDTSGVLLDNTSIKPFVSFTTSLNLWLFKPSGYSITDEHAFKGKIYSYKQIRNGTTIQNLIPALRKSDNMAGMYDTVTNTFFTNQGTGNFVAGPEDTGCIIPVIVDGEVSDTGTVYNINLSASLQKIGTHKDSIKSDGILTREVGVKILDGTENWTQQSSYNRFYTPLTNAYYLGVRTTPSYSTHYKIVTDGRAITDVSFGEGYILDIGSGNMAISFHDTHTSVESFKSWLSAQYAAGTPVAIYYPLSVSTEIPVQVPTISTVKNTNYVDIETDVSPSNVSVTYKKKTK